jgi:hypothetical protein
MILLEKNSMTSRRCGSLTIYECDKCDRTFELEDFVFAGNHGEECYWEPKVPKWCPYCGHFEELRNCEEERLRLLREKDRLQQLPDFEEELQRMEKEEAVNPSQPLPYCWSCQQVKPDVHWQDGDDICGEGFCCDACYEQLKTAWKTYLEDLPKDVNDEPENSGL